MCGKLHIRWGYHNKGTNFQTGDTSYGIVQER